MKSLAKRTLSLLLSVFMLLTVCIIPVSAEEQAESTQSAVQPPEDRDINFNENWKFYLGTSSSAQNKDFSDTSWEDVSLPHDFSIFQNFTTSGTEVESGWLPGGTGWYRKHFTMDASDEGKTVTLSFDGSYNHTYVYVNGTYVGENHYGYNSFAFDISDHLVCDGKTDNVIAVKVVNQLSSSRWYSGSGIYRDVTLTVTNPVHVAMNGTYITTPNLEQQRNGNVTVNVETVVANDSSSNTAVTVRSTMLDANGVAVSDPVNTQANVSGGNSTTVNSTLQVYAPELWSVESPALYILKSEVIIDNNVVDVNFTDFGFRYFKFDANTGFSLNGVPMKLKGVCLHHDQGALGAAAYNDAMRRQLVIMKDMGCNAIRTSHNMADKDFIRMCNEMGFLVMEEAFDGWSAAKNGNTHDFSEYFNKTISADNGLIGARSGETWVEFTLKSMVLRDRNDPSIIMWDIGNEITNIINGGNTSQYTTHCSNMISWVQSLDKTRPITHGDNNGAVRTTSTGVTAKVDRLIAESGGVVGFNYYVSQMATTHSNYPKWKLVATESVSSINSRGAYNRYSSSSSLYQSSRGPYVGNAYDNYCVFWGTTAHDGWYQVITKDYISGEFFWTGFDYIGEPTPWWRTEPGTFTDLGAAPNSSYFGAVDTAGFPKDKYYFYRSQWNEKDTTAHLVTAWDADNQYVSSGKTPVWIYTNAPKIELYRTDSNGNTLKLATATRKVNTTAAGYTYGTYSTTVNNSSYCSKITTSGATAMSVRVNVTYPPGSIYVVAYDANGNVIENTVGNSRVNTPGAAAKIDAYADKTEIVADGYSLSYITLDITDSNGNLDTAAANRIQLSLTGEGEIVGVDNGDPATLRKYQQSTVLTSATTANIDAYAGKALVIVRSTKTGGGFTLNATSSGLSSDSVWVNTVAQEETEIPVEEITLNVNEIELEIGETYTLEAEVAPEDATDKTVTWTSSDPEIVVVEDGVVTAVAPGTAVVTAAVGEITAECRVTVAEAAPVVTGITLSRTALSLVTGDTVTLTAEVTPAEAANVQVIWNSSDSGIVTVADGVVTAVAPGNALITAAVGDITAECCVTVAEPAPVVTGITLNRTALSMNEGDTATLTAQITPAEAAGAQVIWSSSDSGIVTVTDGVVTAVAPGSAVITAAVGDITAECQVTVAQPAPAVTGIEMSETMLTLTEGDIVTLTAKITPAEAADAEVIWRTSARAIATVTDGTVTAISEGTVIITATVGEYSASCTITVKAPAEGPEKVAPTVSVKVTYQNSRTTVTGQSDIFVNPDLYYEEVKHGILYIPSSLLGSRNLIVSTSGASNKVVSDYEEDGTFSYTFKPLSGGMAYTYRAYVYYEKPDGSRIYVYSPMVRGSGRSFSVD